jgi:hypothetical protein
MLLIISENVRDGYLDISHYKIRDWRTNQDAINKMRGEIDDILFEVAKQHGLDLSMENHDAIIDRCIEVAIANED